MDFLFENPFLIIILLGLLSSLFGRNKQQDNEEKPRPVFQEPSNPVEIEETYTPDTVKSEREQYEPQLSRTDTTAMEQSNDWYSQLEQSRERLKEVQVGNKYKITDHIKSKSLYKKDKQLEDDSSIAIQKNLKSTALIESFIMAEVLQKPVSKRQDRV